MMRLLLFLLTTTVFSQNEFLTIENFLYVEDEIQVWSNDSIYRFNKNLQLVSIKQNHDIPHNKTRSLHRLDSLQNFIKF